jgi:hypothetical protein
MRTWLRSLVNAVLGKDPGKTSRLDTATRMMIDADFRDRRSFDHYSTVRFRPSLRGPFARAPALFPRLSNAHCFPPDVRRRLVLPEGRRKRCAARDPPPSSSDKDLGAKAPALARRNCERTQRLTIVPDVAAPGLFLWAGERAAPASTVTGVVLCIAGGFVSVAAGRRARFDPPLMRPAFADWLANVVDRPP